MSHEITAREPRAPAPGAAAATAAPTGELARPAAGGLRARWWEAGRWAAALAVVDFALRLAFFFVAPLLLSGLALVLPIAGALVNVGLALAFFFLGPVLRPRVERRRWLARLLRKLLAFDAFYRENPPRPFVYYLFYPLLFPYWLLVARARREFWVFKGFTLLTLGVLLASSAVEYASHWGPELGFAKFLGAAAVVFAVESVVVLAFVMPLATTAVSYHLTGKKRRLAVLAAVVVAAVALGAARYATERHGRVPLLAQLRLRLRTAAAPERSRDVRGRALLAAREEFLANPDAAVLTSDVRRLAEAEVSGPPLERARAVLAELYEEDEARCFLLLALAPRDRGRMLLLYSATGNSEKGPLWIGAREDGELFDDRASLPPGTRRIMNVVAEK